MPCRPKSDRTDAFVDDVVLQLRDLHAVLAAWATALPMFERNSERCVDAARLGLASRHLAKTLELLEDPGVVEHGVLAGGVLLGRLLEQMAEADLEGGAQLTRGHHGDGMVLADFLSFLAAGGHSGVVTARATGASAAQGAGESFVLELQAGQLVYAHGSASAERFGDVLVARGSIEESVLAACLSEPLQQPGEFLGQMLLRIGAIDRAGLVDGIEAQMRNTLTRALEAEDVRFAFEPELSLVTDPVVRWNVTGLLLDLARRADENRGGAPDGKGAR
ncbi:MAG: DUF4388 domain-containing protein [Planctomycetota bacterium]